MNENRKNGFSRNYLPGYITTLKEINLLLKTSYIAGVSETNLYLGNASSPFQYSIINNLKNKKDFSLNAPKNISLTYSALQLTIDSPLISMIDYRTSYVLKGNLHESFNTILKLDNHGLTAGIPISNTTAIVYTYIENLKQRVIAKKKIDGKTKYSKIYFLEKKGDGKFTLDGKLHFYKNRLFFIYYYKNEFIELDTNLNLIYKAKTIDTNSTAKVQTAYITSNKATTFATPPQAVNKKSFVFDNKLFIYSELRANNDSEKTINNNFIIDVYNLSNRKYGYSFLIPKYKGQRFKGLAINRKIMYVLFENSIVVFKIND